MRSSCEPKLAPLDPAESIRPWSRGPKPTPFSQNTVGGMIKALTSDWGDGVLTLFLHRGTCIRMLWMSRFQITEHFRARDFVLPSATKSKAGYGNPHHPAKLLSPRPWHIHPGKERWRPQLSSSPASTHCLKHKSLPTPYPKNLPPDSGGLTQLSVRTNTSSSACWDKHSGREGN